ncbi:hypothetical protein F511_31965 [Dorcoceras hygrometricum]|uniref:Uncharacterized protein n=1 Tax=Dorcoceras hygrometricum TaxID=472368 RepID=A0A2Z7DCC7_9LAMI|nr:hypothetical protein F511_31965 [Dorcoceras hygrometricum]
MLKIKEYNTMLFVYGSSDINILRLPFFLLQEGSTRRFDGYRPSANTQSPSLAQVGSRRANTRINEEAPRVGYCYARGNQQREFLTHLLVYASAGLLVCRLVLMTKARRRRFICERKSVEASM